MTTLFIENDEHRKAMKLVKDHEKWEKEHKFEKVPILNGYKLVKVK